MKTIKMKIILVPFFALLVIAGSVNRLFPAPGDEIQFYYESYISESSYVYIESISIENLLKKFKEFYLSLRGDEGANDLTGFGTLSQEKLGFNLLDPASLKQIGVNTELPFGFFMNETVKISGIQDLQSNTPQIQELAFYVPASNPDQLFKVIVEIIQKKLSGKQPGQQSDYQEITKGKLFGSQKDQLFIAKGEKFIVFSTKKDLALTCTQKSQKPIAEVKKFISFKKYAKISYASQSTAGLFYMNSDKYDISLPFFLHKAQADTLIDSIIKEIRVNTDFMGGSFSMNSSGLKFNQTIKYRDGFLSDGSSIVSGLLSWEKKDLASDFYSKKPIFYTTLRFNLKEYLKIIKIVLGENYQNSNQELNQKYGVDLEKDLLEALQGNVTFLVGAFPDQKEYQNVNKWSFSLSMGYKKERNKDIKSFMEKMAKFSQKSDPATKFQKAAYSGGVLWTITSPEKQKQPKNPKVAPKNTLVFIFLGDDEGIITANKDHLAKIISQKKSGKKIMTQYLGVSSSEDDKTNFILFLDLDSLKNFLVKTDAAVFLLSAMPYIDRLDNVTAKGTLEKDSHVMEFNLKLKK